MGVHLLLKGTQINNHIITTTIIIIQLEDADGERNIKLNNTKTIQLTELHAKSSFFKRCLVSLSGGSLIR